MPLPESFFLRNAMSNFLVVYDLREQPVDVAMVTALLAVGHNRVWNEEGVWIDSAVALAHQGLWITPEEVGEKQPLIDPDGKLAIACDARIDNRYELIAALDLDTSEGRGLSDSALVLLSYRRWGSGCVEHLLGDFAFALWDAARHQLFLARDALGARNICYYRDEGVFVAATEIEQVLAHPAVKPELNEGKVAAFLLSRWDNQEETYFQRVSYCPPGHAMVVSDTEVRLWRHWDVDLDHRTRYRNDGDYAEHFRNLFNEAVRCRLRSAGQVGISLSGGLDSTSVAAVAASELPTTGSNQTHLKSFSYVFDEFADCDERAYIEPVVERFGLDATYLPGDDLWTLRNSDTWPGARGYVMWDAYALLPAAIRAAARAGGCRVLLSGYFGDQLFGGARFWLTDMVAEGRLSQALKVLKGSRSQPGSVRRALDDGLRPFLPHRLRQTYRRVRPRPLQAANPAIHPDLIERTGMERPESPSSAQKRFSRPGQWQRYRALVDSLTPQGSAAIRPWYSASGMELLDPFRDRRLVECVLAFPADQMGRPSRSKWVLRNAVKDTLPPSIAERTDKTTFYPLFEHGLAKKETATVTALLSDPLVVRRRFVRQEWLREEMKPGRPWTDGGYPLWLCLSLELWLRRYR